MKVSVRRLGEETTKGLVLMNGLGTRPIHTMFFESVPEQAAITAFAKAGACTVQVCDSYYFMYPAGYEALTEVSLEKDLHRRFQSVYVSLDFAEGSSLFNVLAALSHSLGLTLVADNAVANASCGEMRLPEASLGEALEALLKSARVVDFEVESTQDYVFIHKRGRAKTHELLLNEEPLDSSQRAMLEERVNLVLPEGQSETGDFKTYRGALPLVKVLPSLSRQLGCKVRAQAGLEGLPINPVAMQDVPLQTALELLIRQWLSNDYGYVVSGEGVLDSHPELPPGRFDILFAEVEANSTDAVIDIPSAEAGSVIDANPNTRLTESSLR